MKHILIPHPTPSDLKHFGLLVGFVLLCIGIFFHPHYPKLFSIFGITLILFGFFIPSLLRIPYRLWMLFGVLLGEISTRIILFLFFYCIFSPFALLMKIFGKKFIDLNPYPAQTYWHFRTKKTVSPAELLKQF